MATYTSNYGWTKPSGSDNVDISVLNDNLDDQDSTIHDAFLNMAPPFSESSTYAVDDIVLYGTGLYKCHTAVVTPGSWTGTNNWQVYKLSEGGSGGGGTTNYNQLTNKPQINSVELSGNKTTNDLGIRFADLPDAPTLGTASSKNVPVSGDAGSSEVVLGNDSRLTDSRPASDVSSWAKQATKPTYTASEVGAIPSTEKGSNGGVAELDSNGKVPSSQLPSYVDDVLSYASQSAFPATGETGKIYIAEDTNKTYRWSGSVYAEISESLALGETSSTAYRGDRGKTAYDHSQTTGNPHGTTASQVMMSDGTTSVEEALDAVMPKTVHTVTADGVKTYAQLFIELANKGTGGNALKINSLTHSIVNQSNYFACNFNGGNKIDIKCIYMTTSTAIYKCTTINNDGTVSWIDMSNTVPSSGLKIEKVIL